MDVQKKAYGLEFPKEIQTKHVGLIRKFNFVTVKKRFNYRNNIIRQNVETLSDKIFEGLYF